MSHRPALKALQLLTSQRWAITREALERMVAIADRSMADPQYFATIFGQDEFAPASAEEAALRKETPRWALLSRPATAHPQSERIGVSGGVAILTVSGPLCRYASWFQECCGMTSYQLVAEDFRIALEDPSIRAIVMHLDSPGGETNGCSELAALIHANRGKKPIVAMVSDAAASAAYWIAAACDEIVVSPSAYVGSIGVYWEITDYSAAEAEAGIKVWRIVSSQSPNKVPDPADAAGKAQLQQEVDQFADAFLAAAAEYRGTTAEELIEAGNAGGIFIGRHAVERGLADRVATTEDVLAELAADPSFPTLQARRAERAKARATTQATIKETGMKQNATASGAATPAAGPRAYAEGDEIRSLVGRDISIAEGATGTVAEVREGVTVLAITTEEGDCRWLIADEEIELTSAKAEGEPAAPKDGEEDEAAPPAAAGAITTVAQLAKQYPALVGQVRQAATKAERARVSELVALDPRQATKPLTAAIANGETPSKAARALLAASRDPAQAALATIVAAEAGAVPTNSAETEDGADGVAGSINRLVEANDPQARRRARRSSNN